MACQGRYDLPCAIHGDSWKGVDVIRISVDNDSPSDALSLVKIDVLDYATKAVVLTLTSATTGTGTELDPIVSGGITILDAALWTIKIDPILRIDLPAGKYEFDIEFTDVNDIRNTYLYGIWKIKADRTV